MWEPLVRGSEADPVREALHAIADDLAAAGGEEPSVESAGSALFYSYLARYSSAAAHRTLAEAMLDRVFEATAELALPPGLHGGFAGMAWVTQHLRRLAGDEAGGEGDPLHEIDDAILSLVATRPWSGSYDLIMGLVGLGVYFLERLPAASAHRGLERVVRRLAEVDADADAGGLWLTPPERLPAWQLRVAPEGRYDLGVAHGMPAVAGLLAAACRVDAESAIARPLLGRVVASLRSQRAVDGSPCTFPAGVILPTSRQEARFAWCYGDPGIAACLFGAARAVAEPELERLALGIARQGARVLPEEAKVDNPDLCHGATGLLHIFNRFYQATGEEVFLAAARRWLTVALEMREPGRWLGGFWSLAPGAQGPLAELEKTSQPGFLEGGAGVGLALLATVDPRPPDWDRWMMITLADTAPSAPGLGIV